MRHPATFLLAVLLFAAPALGAQAQTPKPAPPAQGSAAAAPAMKAWFLRLIPPRPTFDKDMTEAEGTAMAAHFAYWKEKFDKGICLVGGPVLDPKGVFGILVIEAPSEAAARELADGDPSVKAGVNRIEVAEMQIAFFAKTK